MNTSHQLSLERLANVMLRTGMGRSWIYREVAAGRFPRPLRVGGASCWDSRDVDSWIEDQVRAARVAR